MKTLKPTDKHLMRLVRQGAKEDGWAPVSSMVWPHIQHLPPDLVELQSTDGGGGRARLTHDGHIVLDWV